VLAEAKPSFAVAANTYVPVLENVAEVEAPVALAMVTVPGPLTLLHVTVGVATEPVADAVSTNEFVRLGTPTTFVPGLVIETVGPGFTVTTSVALPVPPELVALRVTLKVPLTVGVPLINPFVVLTLRPVGKPLAA
jgi:hypothetical protein